MASDSRVSGPDEAPVPNPSPEGPVDAGTRPQPPESKAARPKAGNGTTGNGTPDDDKAQPAEARGKGPIEKSGSVEKTPAADADKRTKEAVRKTTTTTQKVATQKVTAGVATVAQSPPSEQQATAGALADDTLASQGTKSPEQGTGSRWLSGAGGNRFLLLNAVPSWFVSMVVHAALLMILALMTLPERPPEKRIVAVASPNDVEEIENLDREDIAPLDVEVFEGAAPADVTDARTTTADYDLPSLDDVSAAPEQIKLEGFGEMSDLQEALLDRVGGGTGSGLGEVRGAKARRGMIEKYGGSAGSEAAVAAALEWLAAHQMGDGGWDFDHTKGPCKGQCTHPGVIPPARNGATAIALLPFLGAGQTHKEGKYKETVERGLVYLVRSMKLGNNMGDLSDAGGRLYSHGLASIALCEAFAMTNDPGLLQPAQLSLNFIVYAQDPIGGGWRYRPQQAGDTSVVGWQLMACKSGHMAYLKVPRKTILGASKFLDFVQMDNGAKYGYTVPAQGPATTAVGLLCRMYLGWKQDNPSLQAGVEYLSNMGPSDNIYYDYYATQVMRHYGGEQWEAWNAKMRDKLVNSQDKSGHAKGSWYITRSPHAGKGGRLYCTAMATMILEVYYRHMPIYGKQAAEEEFPL